MAAGKLAVVIVIALTGVACSHGSKPPPASPQSAAYRNIAATTRLAVVPANTTFRVTMADALSSANASPQQSFTATLAEPILAGDGRVVAEAGSELKGHVVSVHAGTDPRLAIMFDSIATRGGHAMFDVRVADAVNPPFEFATSRKPEEMDADLVVKPMAAAIGGGPLSEEANAAVRAVAIPKSAELRLVLNAPMTINLPK